MVGDRGSTLFCPTIVFLADEVSQPLHRFFFTTVVFFDVDLASRGWDVLIAAKCAFFFPLQAVIG